MIYASITFAVLFAVAFVSLRWLLPGWWKKRAAKVVYFATLAVVVLSLGTWLVGTLGLVRGVTRIGVTAGWSLLAIVFPLTMALVLAGIVQRLSMRILRVPPVAPEGERGLTRRAVIQWGSAAIPAAALGASAVGLVSARRPPELRTIDMPIAGLPTSLVGLHILQLTDLHLGHAWHVDHLERFLDGAASSRPDLVVITGDVADDLPQLAPALALVLALKPRLGVHAVPGNHEYFRGMRAVGRIFEKSGVPLLLDRGVAISSDLYLAGADDPVRHPGDNVQVLRRCIDKAIDGAPSAGMHLLLSHRPDGFIPAAERGLHLTLSGHTHGVQVGAFGRSVFEPIAPNKFLWGAYARGKSRLYTSSGFGHWLPFRLGCAAEAPLIVLAQA